MVWIAFALGAFYVLAAILVFQRIRIEWLLDNAIEALTSKPEPDRYRVVFMAGSALLYGAAGVALLAQSSVAVWLLGAGLIAQAVYYAGIRLFTTPEEPAGDERWSKAWNAAIISTAAFAFAAYAARAGVLT